MNLKQAAEGRWQGILAALGVPEKHRDPTRNGPCPFCKQGTDTYRFTDYMERGCFYCHKCGPGDGIKFVQLWLNCGYAEACREVEKVMGMAKPVRRRRNGSAEAARKIWGAAGYWRPGDPVCSYLEGRGLDPRKAEGDFRVARVWDKASKRAWASMVLPIVWPDRRGMAGIHVTHLEQRGGQWRKAAINAPRKQYKFGATLAGAAIQLGGQSAEGRLAVAEGVETALAVSEMGGLPCWAAISTALLRKFKPPDGIGELVICGDNDAGFAGQAAAYNLAERLSRGEMEIKVAIPKARGTDWLDFLNARKGGGDG